MLSLACGVDGASVSVSRCDSIACHCNAGCTLPPNRCLQLDIAPECHVYLSSVEQHMQCHPHRQCQQHLNQCVEVVAAMLVCSVWANNTVCCSTTCSSSLQGMQQCTLQASSVPPRFNHSLGIAQSTHCVRVLSKPRHLLFTLDQIAHSIQRRCCLWSTTVI